MFQVFRGNQERQKLTLEFENNSRVFYFPCEVGVLCDCSPTAYVTCAASDRPHAPKTIDYSLEISSI